VEEYKGAKFNVYLETEAPETAGCKSKRVSVAEKRASRVKKTNKRWIVSLIEMLL
jgi:hypothetical protein